MSTFPNASGIYSVAPEISSDSLDVWPNQSPTNMTQVGRTGEGGTGAGGGGGGGAGGLAMDVGADEGPNCVHWTTRSSSPERWARPPDSRLSATDMSSLWGAPDEMHVTSAVVKEAALLTDIRALPLNERELGVDQDEGEGEDAIATADVDPKCIISAIWLSSAKSRASLSKLSPPQPTEDYGLWCSELEDDLRALDSQGTLPGLWMSDGGDHIVATTQRSVTRETTEEEFSIRIGGGAGAAAAVAAAATVTAAAPLLPKPFVVSRQSSLAPPPSKQQLQQPPPPPPLETDMGNCCCCTPLAPCPLPTNRRDNAGRHHQSDEVSSSLKRAPRDALSTIWTVDGKQCIAIDRTTHPSTTSPSEQLRASKDAMAEAHSINLRQAAAAAAAAANDDALSTIWTLDGVQSLAINPGATTGPLKNSAASVAMTASKPKKENKGSDADASLSTIWTLDGRQSLSAPTDECTCPKTSAAAKKVSGVKDSPSSARRMITTNDSMSTVWSLDGKHGFALDRRQQNNNATGASDLSSPPPLPLPLAADRLSGNALSPPSSGGLLNERLRENRSRDTRSPDVRHMELRPLEVRAPDPRCSTELRHLDMRTSSDLRTSPERRSSDMRSSNDMRAPLEMRTSDMRTLDGRTSPMRTSDIRLHPMRPSDIRLTPMRPSDIRLQPMRPSDLRLTPMRPPDMRTSDVRVTSMRSPDMRTSDIRVTSSMRSADMRPSDIRVSPMRPPDMRTSDIRVSPMRPPDMRTSDIRVSPMRPLDMRTSDMKLTAIRPPDIRLPNMRPLDMRTPDLRPLDLRHVPEKDLTKCSLGHEDISYSSYSSHRKKPACGGVEPLMRVARDDCLGREAMSAGAAAAMAAAAAVSAAAASMAMEAEHQQGGGGGGSLAAGGGGLLSEDCQSGDYPRDDCSLSGTSSVFRRGPADGARCSISTLSSDRGNVFPATAPVAATPPPPPPSMERSRSVERPLQQSISAMTQRHDSRAHMSTSSTTSAASQKSGASAAAEADRFTLRTIKEVPYVIHTESSSGLSMTSTGSKWKVVAEFNISPNEESAAVTSSPTTKDSAWRGGGVVMQQQHPHQRGHQHQHSQHQPPPPEGGGAAAKVVGAAPVPVTHPPPPVPLPSPPPPPPRKDSRCRCGLAASNSGDRVGGGGGGSGTKMASASQFTRGMMCSPSSCGKQHQLNPPSPERHSAVDVCSLRSATDRMEASKRTAEQQQQAALGPRMRPVEERRSCSKVCCSPPSCKMTAESKGTTHTIVATPSATIVSLDSGSEVMDPLCALSHPSHPPSLKDIDCDRYSVTIDLTIDSGAPAPVRMVIKDDAPKSQSTIRLALDGPPSAAASPGTNATRNKEPYCCLSPPSPQTAPPLLLPPAPSPLLDSTFDSRSDSYDSNSTSSERPTMVKKKMAAQGQPQGRPASHSPPPPCSLSSTTTTNMSGASSDGGAHSAVKKKPCPHKQHRTNSGRTTTNTAAPPLDRGAQHTLKTAKAARVSSLPSGFRNVSCKHSHARHLAAAAATAAAAGAAAKKHHQQQKQQLQQQHEHPEALAQQHHQHQHHEKRSANAPLHKPKETYYRSRCVTTTCSPKGSSLPLSGDGRPPPLASPPPQSPPTAAARKRVGDAPPCAKRKSSGTVAVAVPTHGRCRLSGDGPRCLCSGEEDDPTPPQQQRKRRSPPPSPPEWTEAPTKDVCKTPSEGRRQSRRFPDEWSTRTPDESSSITSLEARRCLSQGREKRALSPPAPAPPQQPLPHSYRCPRHPQHKCRRGKENSSSPSRQPSPPPQPSSRSASSNSQQANRHKQQQREQLLREQQQREQREQQEAWSAGDTADDEVLSMRSRKSSFTSTESKPCFSSEEMSQESCPMSALHWRTKSSSSGSEEKKEVVSELVRMRPLQEGALTLAMAPSQALSPPPSSAGAPPPPPLTPPPPPPPSVRRPPPPSTAVTSPAAATEWRPLLPLNEDLRFMHVDSWRGRAFVDELSTETEPWPTMSTMATSAPSQQQQRHYHQNKAAASQRQQQPQSSRRTSVSSGGGTLSDEDEGGRFCELTRSLESDAAVAGEGGGGTAEWKGGGSQSSESVLETGRVLSTIWSSDGKTSNDSEQARLIPSDECTEYGLHVAHRIREYSQRTRSLVQLQINDVLFRADTGQLEPSPSMELEPGSACAYDTAEEDDREWGGGVADSLCCYSFSSHERGGEGDDDDDDKSSLREML